jgi:hypothetical protein
VAERLNASDSKSEPSDIAGSNPAICTNGRIDQEKKAVALEATLVAVRKLKSCYAHHWASSILMVNAFVL